MISDLPKSVNILDHVFTVKICDHASEVDSEDRQALLGQVDYWTCEIRLLRRKDPRAMWNVFWHEVTHAFLYLLDVRAESTEEKLTRDEHVVDMIALAINSITLHNDFISIGVEHDKDS